MHKFRAIAGAGLLSATLLVGGGPAWATSSSSTTTHPSNDPVRTARLGDTAVPRGSVDLGHYDPARAVSFEVVLAPSNPAGEQSLLDEEYNASSPLYHHWLTPASFNAEFGPTAATVTATQSWLAGRGLTAKRSSEFTLSVTAPSGQVGQALGVTFESYKFKGRAGYAPNAAPLVPTGVAPQVSGILGLNTMRPLATHDSLRAPAASSGRPAAVHPNYSGTTCAQANSSLFPGDGETMLTEAQTFGVTSLWNAGLQGAGQSIGLFELAGYQPADISAYKSCFGLSNTVTSVGSAGVDLFQGGTSEADLDIEEAIQQAPGASVVVYQADNSSDPSVTYNLYNQIVSADAVQTFSSSWGECEPDDNQGGTGYESAMNGLLQQASLQGQSFFAASGDAGAEDCAFDYVVDPATTSPWSTSSVDFPGASPYATSVGGTEFVGEGENYYTAQAQSVSTAVTNGNLTTWNFCQNASGADDTDALSDCEDPNQGGGYGAGGGGMSSVWAAPSWQTDYFSAAGYSAPGGCGSKCRQVPDISGNAGYPMLSYGPDPYNYNCPAGSQGGGCSDYNEGFGTSYAAPFMAGVTAARNSGCQTSTGNFSALAYSLAHTANGYATAFVDVTQGNNDMLNHYGGARYPAQSGYDMATGLGTPVPAGFACPEVTSITQASSPVTSVVAGSAVTINGLGLENASIYFGPALATVIGTPTATSVTVTVPQVSSSGNAATVTVYGALNGESGTLTRPLTVTGVGTPATCASASGISLKGAVGIAAVTINGCPGYFVADADGRVAAFGSATTHGDLSQVHLGSPIVGITATADGQGYYMFAAGGGIFCYGSAAQNFHGSAVQYHPRSPVIALAVVPDGSGYWMVTSAGGMFTFGGAKFYGAAVSYGPKTPISGMAVAPNGTGYWQVTQAGGVFSFGTAPFEGTTAPTSLVVGVTGTPDGQGYTLVDRTGKVYALGDAPNYGSAPPGTNNVVDLSPTPADDGYYLVTSGGGVINKGPGTTYFGRV